MNKIRTPKKVGYEDLMRELNILEQQLLLDDRDAAMSLMVLETKLRERFQDLEYRLVQVDPTYRSPLMEEDDVTFMDFGALMPTELPPFPTLHGVEEPSRKRRVFETIGLAALLAVMTAFGVFGLASLLHFALSWIA